MNINRLVTRNLESQFQSLKKQGINQGRDLTYRDNQIVATKELPRLSPKTSMVQRRPFTKTGVVPGTSANVGTFDPLIRNPLLNISNWYLPERREILAQWLRYYDRFDPLVGNCLDLHATIPFSRFSFSGIDDTEIRQTYEDMSDDIRLFRKILEISREYELIGEVFPFSHWSDTFGYFDDVLILNPDYVNVRGIQQAGKDTVVLELIPDPEIRSLVHSQNIADMMIVAELDPDLIYAVENNMNIQLDKFNVEPLMRKQSAYDLRGTSIVLRCVKPLMYKDKLREAQFSVAEGKITPYQIWKLGDPNNDYMPTAEDLDDFRSILQAGKGDNDYNIVTHYALDVEFIGLEGKVMNIIKELEYVDKEIMTALFTNEAFVTGKGPTYSNASVAMRVYQARYDVKRDLIVDYIQKKLFEPVAMANEFYKRREADIAHGVRTQNDRRELIVPNFKWEGKVNLVDDPERLRIYQMLRAGKEVPLEPLLELLGYEAERIQQILKNEQGGEFAFSKVSERMAPPMPGGGGFGAGFGVTPSVPPQPTTPEGQINSEQRSEIQQFKNEQKSFAVKKKQ